MIQPTYTTARTTLLVASTQFYRLLLEPWTYRQNPTPGHQASSHSSQGRSFSLSGDCQTCTAAISSLMSG